MQTSDPFQTDLVAESERSRYYSSLFEQFPLSGWVMGGVPTWAQARTVCDETSFLIDIRALRCTQTCLSGQRRSATYDLQQEQSILIYKNFKNDLPTFVSSLKFLNLWIRKEFALKAFRGRSYLYLLLLNSAPRSCLSRSL